MIVGEYIDEFGKLLANRQSILPQICGVFNIHLLLLYVIHQIFLLHKSKWLNSPMFYPTHVFHHTI